MPKEFIVEMANQYPFGELGQALSEDAKAIVKKTLKCSCENERDVIKQMVHFIKAAKHENLINIERILESPEQVQLYYEYAPFRLQKWVTSVDQNILVALQEQMLDLAQYLTRSSIRFTFTPECLGLSNQMNIKYFLNQFSIDFEGQQQHLEELKIQIGKFFKQTFSLGQFSQPQQSKGCSRMESLSTNASISPLDDLISLTHKNLKKCEQKGTKSSQLAAKVENSMKKSLQVLMRFKKVNQN